MNKLWRAIGVKRTVNGVGEFEYSTFKWCNVEVCLLLEAVWAVLGGILFVLMLGMVSYDSSIIAIIGVSFYTFAWFRLTPIYHDIIHGYGVEFKPIF